MLTKAVLEVVSMRYALIALGLAAIISVAGETQNLSQVQWGLYEMDPIKGPPSDTTLPISWSFISDLWGGVEKTKGKYDFSRLDYMLDVARKRGWTAVLRIEPAGHPHKDYDYGYLETPTWLDNENLVMKFGDYREPVYWNTTYSRYVGNLHDALIQRYKNSPQIMGYWVAQHIWGEYSNAWDVPELLDQYESKGYSRAAWVKAINDLVDNADQSRTQFAPNKLLIGFGFGLCDADGWLPESGNVIDYLLKKKNVAYGTMQLSENGLKDRNVAKWVNEARARGQKIIFIEDHPSATEQELRNKLSAAANYAPQYIALQNKTWNQPWVKSVLREFGVGDRQRNNNKWFERDVSKGGSGTQRNPASIRMKGRGDKASKLGG
jgi:hypothetical protein